MKTYRVTTKGSIAGPNGLLRSGTEFKENEIPKIGLLDAIKSGYAVLVGAPEPVEAPDAAPALKPDNPVVEMTAPLKSAGAPVEVKVIDVPVKSNDAIANGGWNFDPAALAGKSLDQLNAMIVERDAAQMGMATVEEATAFLSQDFKGV